MTSRCPHSHPPADEAGLLAWYEIEDMLMNGAKVRDLLFLCLFPACFASVSSPSSSRLAFVARRAGVVRASVPAPLHPHSATPPAPNPHLLQHTEDNTTALTPSYQPHPAAPPFPTPPAPLTLTT